MGLACVVLFPCILVQGTCMMPTFAYFIGLRTVGSSSEGGEIPGRGDRKTTQELAGLDFSKGFGPLITEPHETFGMQMLRDSDDYKFSVELYKTMSDSDSEASGLSG